MKIIEHGENKPVEMIVPHEGGEVTFMSPPLDPASERDISKDLRDYGLFRPTLAQTVSLFYDALKNESEEFPAIVSEFLVASLGSPNYFIGSDYVKCECWGIYVTDDPSILLPPFHTSWTREFEKGNFSLRRIPYGYKTGKQTRSEYESNPFVIGLVGKEGAQKLGEIIEILKKKGNDKLERKISEEKPKAEFRARVYSSSDEETDKNLQEIEAETAEIRNRWGCDHYVEDLKSNDCIRISCLDPYMGFLKKSFVSLMDFHDNRAVVFPVKL